MKWNILSRLLVVLSVIGICSCQDEELFPAPGNYDLHAVTRAESGKSSGLELQSDGSWKAKRRVPLVGMGRIVNFYSGSFVDVVGVGDELDKLTDTNLENEFSPSKVAGINLLKTYIASIRDLNYVYAGGQKAGFLCKLNDSSLLNATLLKSFTLTTYLGGEEKESHTFSNASGLLDLGIGNIAGSNGNTFLVETTFNQSFDEIRLSINDIKLEVAGALTIYYAYVGENEMIPAVNNGGYFGNNVTADGPYFSWTLDKLINEKLADGITFSLLGGLLTDPHMTIDFGKEIPAGSEVGFYVTAGKALELGAGHSIRVRTFDEKGGELETYSYTQVVELGLLGGGKYIFSLSTKKPCRKVEIKFFGIDVTVGATTVHYAFLREGTKVDSSSNFSVGNITVYTPVYRLPVPKEGEGQVIGYELLSKPDKNASIEKVQFGEMVGSGYILQGMNVTGDYVVKATYKDNAGNISEHIFVVTREKRNQKSCETPLVNTKEHSNRYQAYVPDKFTLVQVGTNDREGELNKVVNENLKDFIRYEKGLKIDVVSNEPIVGIKTVDNSVINSTKKNIRVGFVINKQKKLLGVDALKFLRIRLKKDGAVVGGNVAHENDAVSLCVVGGSTDKVRLSIDTSVAFNEMELYSTGVLDLNLGDALQVYYAFTEEISNDCIYPGEECMQLITNANYGAVPSVFQAGALKLGGFFTNLGNIVDSDNNSFATHIGVAAVLTNTEIRVSFNTVRGNQEVGFVLSNIDGLADVDLIQKIKIIAYQGGKEVAELGSNADLLKLKLIGSGNRKYVSIMPTVDFDQLGLGFVEAVDALKSVKIHGVFIRPDYDGDGAIDCLMDNLDPSISGFKVEPEDICEGEDAVIRAIGGEPGKQYEIAFSDDTKQKTDTVTVIIDDKGYLKFTEADFIKKLPAGIYGISVTKGQPILLNRADTLTVHPLETTWNKKVDSSDWNQWSNWDRGTPWKCTNVILPSGASKYPDLINDKNPSKKFCCDAIHFEPGAELRGQHRLTYRVALVDCSFKSGQYQLVAAPLKDMVTGDMFVQNVARRANWNAWRTQEASSTTKLHPNYFSAVSVDGDEEVAKYEESRVHPIIYQRFFSQVVQHVKHTRAAGSDDPVIAHTDWSRTFNAVSTPYEGGQGFALRVGEKNDQVQDFDFHFPKSHNTYHFYNINGDFVVRSEAIKRNSVGQLMIDHTDAMPYKVTLSRLSGGSDFVFGNSFMTSISIAEFLKGNTHVKAIRLYRGGQYVDVTLTSASQPTIPTLINPLEAVLLTMNAESTQATVSVSEGMLVSSTTQVGTRSGAGDCLYVKAIHNRSKTWCAVSWNPTAAHAATGHENVSLLLESEDLPEVAVYTVADGKALSIRYQQTDERIPLGFYMKQTGQVELSFETRNAAWKGWRLVDSQTGQAYGLDETVTLNNVASGAGRFYLEKED